MSTFKKLNRADIIVDTTKVTAGYFTGGVGQINAPSMCTNSLADSSEKYYINITQTHPDSSSAATQFAVAFGHVGGSGSNVETKTKSETQAVYQQWATTLLAENEISGGFKFNSSVTGGISGREDQIYVLVGKRALFKDRINKKNWTIQFSGTTGDKGGTSASKLALTDDSVTTAATHTVAGPRYNIVSGSDGSVTVAATTRTYGHFYPEQGVLVFAGSQLSHSMGGGFTTTDTVKYQSGSQKGFGAKLAANVDKNNSVRFINALQGTDAYLKFRSEEDQNTTSYFCRVFSREMNFTNNPTFISGSFNELKHTDMWGSPTVYITGVGLFDPTGLLIAIGKLSTPVKKNFASEATIKVKLTY